MLQDYISFNASKYIKDYYYYKGVLNGLEAKYEALDGIRAVGFSSERVQSSPDHDELEKIAMQRVLLSNKIDDYKEHISLVENAMRVLTQEQREIIDVFFNPDNKKEYFEIGYSKTHAYAIRKSAIEEIALQIVGTRNIKEKRG